MFKFHNISATIFSDLNQTIIIPFFYKNKQSYLYIRDHSFDYNGAFGNDCKNQMKDNREPAYTYMKNLDDQGMMCLNDEYDNILYRISEHYDEEYDDTYISNLDFAQSELPEEDAVIIEFVELLENQLQQHVIYEHSLTWFIHSLLSIYTKDTEFFETHIDFDFTILDNDYSFLQSYDYYALHQNKVLLNKVSSTLEQKEEGERRKI